MEEERLDIRLIREGRASSREKAKEMIGNGFVSVNGRPAKKAGQTVKEEDLIEVAVPAVSAGDYRSEEVFVSRGGHKLARALQFFGIDPAGLCCLDAGASTGGFTDVLLRRGAARVFAVDVGHGQFDPELAKDERITVREGVNVRYLSVEDFPGPMDLVTADLSFISLTKVLEPLEALLAEGGTLICLVKPQFEAGPGAVDKNGVIRDGRVRLGVLRRVCAAAAGLGLSVRGITYSPIKGPEGNVEFLLYAVKDGRGAVPEDEALRRAVEEAAQVLG